MMGSAKTLILLIVCLAAGSARATYHAQAAIPPLAINELLAANGGIWRDPQGQADDWVEIYNAGGQTVDLAGMYLTDDLDVPRKWRIPVDTPSLTRIAARGYLLLWLDGDVADAGLHAPFGLDAAGDTIALFDTDGTTLIDAVSFGPQRGNFAYGRYPSGAGAWSFLTVPTPGTANAAAYQGVVADPEFSHPRGFYDAPFDVAITCATPGATIYYTLDGTEPVALTGRIPMGTVYTGPLRIAQTTCLRARAVKNGWLSTPANTHTYIFLTDVIGRTQAEVLARGYPAQWFGNYPADYEMDPQITTDPAYARLLVPALLSIPTVALATSRDHLFSHTNNAQTGGIYIYTGHSSTGGRDWERPLSAEMFTRDGGGVFQADCGVRIQGGESRNPPKCPKHSLSLRFRSEYGPGKLEVPLFDGGPVETFDSLQLRGFFNNAWTHWDANQRLRTQYIRDQWMRDALLDMGQVDAGRGFYVHLYLNGIYWGLYGLQERPTAAHYAAYHGGDEDRIDAINGGQAMDGTAQAWNEAKSIVATRNWARIQETIDVDNFIDWTLLMLFAGNQDVQTGGNWRAAGGGPDRRPWRFYSWDSERVLENVNQAGTAPAADPTGLLGSLESIEEFRIRFGDRVHRHLFHGGALTPQRNAARWNRRAEEIDLAVIAESARWGDYRRDMHPYSSGPYLLYTHNTHWVTEKNRLLNEYFPRRTDIALAQFKSRKLYPSLDAPVFAVNGTYQPGGHIASRGLLSMQGTTGTIWYTLDGTDPRVTMPGPADEVKLVPESAVKRVLVPTGPVDAAWRGGRTFDDSAWRSGTGGVGFQRSSGYEAFLGIEVRSLMHGRNATCLVRIPFQVSAATLAGLSHLVLRARCDDGFVAYLNGAEIARKNFVGAPAWNSAASAANPTANAVSLEPFDVTIHAGQLRQGQNILALQALNESIADLDFLISAELVNAKGPAGGLPVGNVSPMAVRYTAPVALPKSVRVKSRALSGATWSALNEAVFAVGPVAQGLRISEIMYHPANTGNPNDPNTEFIELTNIANQAINLDFVRFTKGIDYAFPDFGLPAGGYCLVVKDLAAFEAKYGSGLPVVGEYAGSLSNGGERLELVDAVGTVIQSVTYDDGWFKSTDGQGFSLTVKDPQTTDADNLNEKSAWRPSTLPGGSPGAGDGA